MEVGFVCSERPDINFVCVEIDKRRGRMTAPFKRFFRVGRHICAAQRGNLHKVKQLNNRSLQIFAGYVLRPVVCGGGSYGILQPCLAARMILYNVSLYNRRKNLKFPAKQVDKGGNYTYNINVKINLRRRQQVELSLISCRGCKVKVLYL